MKQYKQPYFYRREELTAHWSKQIKRLLFGGITISKLLANAKKSKQGVWNYINRKSRTRKDIDDLILFIAQKNKDYFERVKNEL